MPVKPTAASLLFHYPADSAFGNPACDTTIEDDSDHAEAIIVKTVIE
jgi:hypothetical protein